MTRVVGTAGHIDHGKTSLLRALTGIDADRLPEEKRRGLTIDVGFAHLLTEDGDALDFVDVPGHDRLVGNMLVGAGEIDACLLVVAADDGPRAQTLEHLALLDALSIRDGVAVVTKADLVSEGRLAEVMRLVGDLIALTSLRDLVVMPVSAVTGVGLEALSAALARLAREPAPGWVTRGSSRLAIDRVFSVRGRGVVVTGSARGAPIALGDRLRLLPGDREVRVRGLQVHDREVERGPEGGRLALLVGGDHVGRLGRGRILSSSRPDGQGAGHPLTATSRMLVTLTRPGLRPGAVQDRDRWPPDADIEARLHIGTDQVEALAIIRGGHAVTLPDGGVSALLRLDREVAASAGDRFVLRRPPPAGLLAGGMVLDAEPPTMRARRRMGPDRIAALALAVGEWDRSAIGDARLALHGILRSPLGDPGTPVRLAADLHVATERAIADAVSAQHAAEPGAPGLPLTRARRVGATTLRKLAGANAGDAAAAADLVLDGLVASGRLRRHGDVVAVAGHRPAAPDPARAAAMETLVATLDVAAPPPLRAAAAAAGCPPDAVRELERDGRIVVVDEDLGWARPTWERLRTIALEMARNGGLTPAALRDATGTSRKYVMAFLEDLQRRGMLRRTATGHIPGPRA